MVKVEIAKPVVEDDVIIRLPKSEAGKLMVYISDNGSWDLDKGGKVAEALYEALYGNGVREVR